MNIRIKILRLYWILSTQLGMDFRKMVHSLFGFPRYVRDFIRFRSSYTGRLEFFPCLHDWHEEGGATRNEYFWQDLIVARKIFEANPERHIDIGSRIDGFVAHLASFREIEIFDVRPVTTQIPGVIFRQANFMRPIEGFDGYCDSVSCLHALEHFGLGRYGDPIDPNGFKHGLANMASLLTKGGVFYLSVPLGIERVEFNANHVFDPRVIISLARQYSLNLYSLTVIQPDGDIEECAMDQTSLITIANKRYALGIFVFHKSK